MSQKLNNILKTFGPGILFASTCIGVSHLVQSTRAGADFGFDLLLIIILANVLKYPFFEFGSRYASATGKSILEGYKQEGKWMLGLYFILSFSCMFSVSAAVNFVTAGMLGNLLGLEMDAKWIAVMVYAICMVVLLLGKFKILDGLLKIVATVLLICTLIAFFAAIKNGPAQQVDNFVPLELGSKTSLMFIIALMGWMPTAVDLSTWNSLWTVERIKQTGYYPKLKETLLDFNIGYAISTLLAICFMTLGALVVYGTGFTLSTNSVAFSSQIIQIYTQSIGPWIFWIISVAAFTTMFSTAITVMDGYSRAMGETIKLLTAKNGEQPSSINLYIPVLIVLSAGALAIIYYFSDSMPKLVDLATTLSFIIAPVIAFINYKVITSKNIKPEFRPKAWLIWLAKAGILFLSVFTLIYFYVFFIGK
jgi:Mn2+/Fe2+ NRAMP family transporter